MRRLQTIAISASLCMLSPLFADKSTKKLESMTVTAQKVEENAQDLPMSASFLDEFNIKDYSIAQTKDIYTYIPNFSSFHAGSRDYWTRIIIRGMTNTAIGDPAAALYIDGISYTNLYTFDQALDDVERIEVLKGPQGTLYGKNAEAGVINIITKSPTNELSGKIALKGGSFKERGINALINTPLVEDKLFLRLSALKSKRDGFVKNITLNERLSDEDTFTAKANVEYRATDSLKFNFIAGHSNLKDYGGYSMVPVDKERYKKATGIKKIGKFEAANDFSGQAQVKNKHANLKASYGADSFDFTSVTSYRDSKNSGTLDADFTPSPIFIGFNEVDTNSIEQELRFSSKKDSKAKWLVGAYFANDEQEYATGYMFDKMAAQMYKMPLFTQDKMVGDINSKDMAIFGQGTLRFFDEKLGLTAGLRAQKSKREMKSRTHTVGGANIVEPFGGMSRVDNVLLPKLGVDYKVSDDFMVYLVGQRGYKAGGFSFAVDDRARAEFKPEFSTQIELGAKTHFKDIGLILNMATFYTKVDDYQDRLMLNPTTIIQANASEVDIMGFELEALYFIGQNLSLQGSFGYTHAEYKNYYDSFTKKSYDGKKVAVIPEYDLNVELKYTHPLGFFASLGMQSLGDRYLDRENTAKIGSATTYNARVGYEKENWDIFLGVKNIFDKEIFLDGFNAGETGYLVTMGGRRVVGLEFNYRF